MFFLLGIVVLILTGNLNIFPTVVLLGNFMVPSTYVAFFYERRHLSTLTMPVTAKGFLYGGILSIFAAALLEPFFLSQLNFFTAFEAGLIEEFAKIVGVVLISRHFQKYSELDGIILGAAVGMGFAALESTGYVFTTFVRSGGSLTIAIALTLLRGLLAPLGHGTWTAILAGILFRESRLEHFHVNGRVFMAYLGVAVLHGLWDGLPILIGAFTTSGPDVLIGEALVGTAGILILGRLWSNAKRIQITRDLPSPESTDPQ